jgi:2-polyprenyl-3-methyl-5-hydroxy-6-metoxy-1,4-benzoquinol methylase
LTTQVPVFVKPFDTLETDLSFSSVRMSHVIEHLPDPRWFLEKAIDFLDDDGIIVM